MLEVFVCSIKHLVKCFSAELEPPCGGDLVLLVCGLSV